MGKLVRKNLILDGDEVRELARIKGTSESEAVRQVVHRAVEFDKLSRFTMAQLEELGRRGTWVDSFGRLPDDD